MKFNLLKIMGFYFALVCCAFANTAAVSFGSSDENALDLVDVLDIALKNNPKIKQAWLNVDVGKYAYRSQLSSVFPTVQGEINYSKSRIVSDYDDVVTIKSEGISPSVSFSYLLFNFGGRTADILNFKYKLNAIKFETNDFVQDFIFQVVNSYYSLFSSLANEWAAKEIENSALEAYKAASVRYDIGLVPLTDKLQAETFYTQKKLIREKAENAVKIARGNLNYLLNLGPTSELNLKIPFMKVADDDFEENVVNLIAKALQNRPDLKAYYETKKAKKAEVYKNATDWLPTVSITGSYGSNNDWIKGGRNNKDSYNIGVSAKMSFFTGGYVFNNTAKSRAELKIINQQIRDLEKNIELDVWTTYQDFITAKKTYITSQILLKSATESENTMLGRYKNGKSSILDLLNAQSELATARYESISSQHNWFITRANLVRALGKISVEEIEALTEAANLDTLVSADGINNNGKKNEIN